MKNILKVEWSNSSLIITVIVAVAVLAADIYLLANHNPLKIAICAAVTLCLLIVALCIPVSINLDSKNLTIRKVVGEKVIPLSSISECGLSYIPVSIKVMGSGGFCGDLGWYKAHDFGSYFSYVLNRKQAFYVILKDKRKYLLSCENPDKAIDEIKSRID